MGSPYPKDDDEVWFDKLGQNSLYPKSRPITDDDREFIRERYLYNKFFKIAYFREFLKS